MSNKLLKEKDASQLSQVMQSNYDSQSIHKKFVKTIYKLGWEWKVEREGICYGIGWSTEILRTILIEPNKITYEYRKAEFLGFPAIEKKKEIGYNDDFCIPLTVDNFDRYIES